MQYFGTDGIRGVVGVSPITADFILKLGWAVGKALSATTQHAKVFIGKDTRISGYMIESALQAGLSAAGANICLLGPMPTPGIAYLMRTFGGDIGIVISASHNSYQDNGIKFFSQAGFKTSTTFEQEIENILQNKLITATSHELGKAKRIDDAVGRYIEYCKSTIPRRIRLDNLKIVVDCANGATYHIAPHVFSELGAQVIPLHITPDGFNINEDCGSIHPESLRQTVLKEKADLGIAFDGDGDRVVMVDNKGEIVDGDEILFIIAKELIRRPHFFGGVVGTQMSNMGLEIALNKLGIVFVRVPVGDQYVIKELIEKNWVLGGESSGHIINLQANTTADGIIAALQVLYAMNVENKELNELKQGMNKYPQKLCNVNYSGEEIDLNDHKLLKVIEDGKKKLGKESRIILRYSGTEPLIRIMVEGPILKDVEQEIEVLSHVIEEMVH